MEQRETAQGVLDGVEQRLADDPGEARRRPSSAATRRWPRSPRRRSSSAAPASRSPATSRPTWSPSTRRSARTPGWARPCSPAAAAAAAGWSSPAPTWPGSARPPRTRWSAARSAGGSWSAPTSRACEPWRRAWSSSRPTAGPGATRARPATARWSGTRTTGEVLAERSESIGTATNNVAEYQGLIAGLEAAAELGAAEVEVADGLQAGGRADVRPLADQAPRPAPARRPGGRAGRPVRRGPVQLDPAGAQPARRRPGQRGDGRRRRQAAATSAARIVEPPREVAAPTRPRGRPRGGRPVPRRASGTDPATVPAPGSRAREATRLILVRHGETEYDRAAPLLRPRRRAAVRAGPGPGPGHRRPGGRARPVRRGRGQLTAVPVYGHRRGDRRRARRPAGTHRRRPDRVRLRALGGAHLRRGARAVAGGDGRLARLDPGRPARRGVVRRGRRARPPGGRPGCSRRTRGRPWWWSRTSRRSSWCCATPWPPATRFLHRLFLDAAGISVLDMWPDGGVAVRTVNDTAHLAGIT